MEGGRCEGGRRSTCRAGARHGARARRRGAEEGRAARKACAKAGEVLAYDVPKRNLAAVGRRAVQASRGRGRSRTPARRSCSSSATTRRRSRARSTSSPRGPATSRSASARSRRSRRRSRRRRRSRSPTRGRSATSRRTLDASETIFEREGRPRRDIAPRLAGALGEPRRARAGVSGARSGGRPAPRRRRRLKLHPFYAEKLFGQAAQLLAGGARRRGRAAGRSSTSRSRATAG